MEKININRKVVSKTNNFQVTSDIIVPDVKPDIVNVMTVNGIPYIYKQECENGRLRVDGNVDSYVVYLSADGDTRSIQTTLNFNNVLESNDIRSTSIVKYKINIESLESKVLNERKVSVIAEISIEYLVYEVQNIEILDDFLSDIPMLQKQEEDTIVKSLVGYNIVKSSLKEDIDIENLDDVAEILKVDLDIVNGEEKISYNKILTKGECNISIMYITEDGKIGMARGSFPVMSFIDMDNVKEDDVCSVEYNIRNMLFKINNKEQHSITAQVDFEILCEASEEKSIKILKDAYSLCNDLDISYKNVEVDATNSNMDEIIDINERINIEDIKNVLGIDKKKIVILKNDNFNIEGEVNLVLYYEATNKNGLNTKQIKLPFIVKVKTQSNFSIVYQNIDSSLSSEDLNLSIKLLVQTTQSNYNNINIIDNIKVLDAPINSDYSVVVYMVKKNDTIWKIAKNFKVTMDSIIKVNNLDNPDLIYPGDKLYILK